MKLYLIEPKKDIYIYEDLTFRDEIKLKYSICDLRHNRKALFNDNKLIDIHLQNKISDTILIDFIGGIVNMPFINKKLIDILGAEFINHNFYLGDIYLNSIKQHNFFSILPKDNTRIVLRGSKKSTHNKCEICNKILYFPWLEMSEYYVIKNTFDCDSKIFMTNFPTLVVEEEILEKIKPLFEKKYKIVPIEILDEPLDGFERDIPW